MKTLASLLFLTILYIGLVKSDTIQVWKPEEFPNPKENPEECGRGDISSSHICDPKNFLDVSNANFLDSMIEKARDDTPCNCSTYYCQDLQVGGVKIGIVLVEKMASTEEENGEKPKFELHATLENAAQFAQDIDYMWNLGQCGDTIIIFYSVLDHVLFTHVGFETIKTLKSTLLSEIAMNHRHLFETGHYFEGFENLIHDYKLVMQRRYKGRVNDPRRPAEPQALQLQGSAGSLAASLIMVAATALLHL